MVNKYITSEDYVSGANKVKNKFEAMHTRMEEYDRLFGIRAEELRIDGMTVQEIKDIVNQKV